MALLQDRYTMASAAEFLAGCQVPDIKSLEKAKGSVSTHVLCPQAHGGGFSVTCSTSSTGGGISHASTALDATTTST
jgi:hypothetical protein